MDALLEIKNLTVRYKGVGEIIKNINMTVGQKEIIGIVGESGCGKTTLIRSIINLLSSNAEIVSGEIYFNGQDITKYSKNQWNHIRGNEIAMIFQNPGSFLNPIMKVEKQFIDHIRYNQGIDKSTARQKAVESLLKMGFSDEEVCRILKSYPFQLSGGMKQRVIIAMVLSLKPKLILADEPTSALDVVTQYKIVNELMEIRDKFDCSIVMVTHNIACAAHMTDRIMVMKNGEIVEFDSKTQVIYHPKMAYTSQLLNSVPRLKGLSYV